MHKIIRTIVLRKSLAPNNRLSNVAIPAILLVALTLIALKFVHMDVSGTTFTILVVAYIILIALVFKGYKSKDIYYDNSNMYLKGDSGVLPIHFSRIRRIKMTLGNISIMGLKFYQYKIEYLDSRESLTDIHFWTTIISSKIEEFGKQVSEVNPYLKIEQWAIS